MPPKNNKKQQYPSIEESLNVEPWPNLPQLLLNFIGRNPHLMLMKSISFVGVTKSWRLGSKQCNSVTELPRLETSDKHQYHSKTHHHTFNITFRVPSYWWLGKRSEPHMHFHGCSHGLIVAGMKDSNKYSLLLPGGRRYCIWNYIPPWDAKLTFMSATLSSYPTFNHNSSIMVLTGCSNPAFVVSHLGCQNKWMKGESTLLDPNCSKRKLMQFTNAIGFEGKFYASSLQGTLVVIEEIESQFQVTRLSRCRAVPSIVSKHFTEYILESNGEILLVFLISQKSIKIVDKVEVFKLQIEDLSWLKLENLGDRTLFAGTNCCMSVTASQVGCRSNCVYFANQAMDGWRIYDMAKDKVFPCCDNAGSVIKEPVWEEPLDVE